MTNRKEKHIEDFLEIINREWNLSVQEMGVLESVFFTVFSGENKKLKQIEHLLNDETEELLESLNDDSSIQRYAERELDLISNIDEDDLVDALDDLNFKWVNKVDIDDMIDYIECKGFEIVETEDNFDIVTKSNLEEMTELFLNLSPQKQSEIINNFKQ